jgi:SAM-dependent methyltransferase
LSKNNKKLLSFTYGTEGAENSLVELSLLLRNSSIPDDELSRNLGIFLTPSTLGRILFMDFLYKKIISIQGIVVEFGCRYGQNIALFNALRNIYDPYNRLRKVVGFDSFEGFPDVVKDDGNNNVGDYSVPKDSYANLKKIIDVGKNFSPLPHLDMCHIIKGDACKTLPNFIKDNPASIIALAYFDMDIYKPTKFCLEMIIDRIPKGGVVGFDEVNDDDMPGETLALFDAIGLKNVSLRRFNPSSRTSYFVKDF